MSVRQFSSAVGWMGLTNEPLELLSELLACRQSTRIPARWVRSVVCESAVPNMVMMMRILSFGLTELTFRAHLQSLYVHNKLFAKYNKA